MVANYCLDSVWLSLEMLHSQELLYKCKHWAQCVHDYSSLQSQLKKKKHSNKANLEVMPRLPGCVLLIGMEFLKGSWKRQHQKCYRKVDLEVLCTNLVNMPEVSVEGKENTRWKSVMFCWTLIALYTSSCGLKCKILKTTLFCVEKGSRDIETETL